MPNSGLNVANQPTVWNANIEKAKGLKIPSWSEQDMHEMLDRSGLSAAILSMGHPVHPYVNDTSEIAPICREINSYAAQLRDAYPHKIGFFATLPPLDQTRECIEEVRFALDELHADGVVVMTSYNQRYLGHPDFRSVWEELDRRETVILVHPSFEGMIPITEPVRLAPPIIDWTHETTRTAVNLIVTNTMRDCSKSKVILSHAGGTLPYVIHRAADLCTRLRVVDLTADEFVEQAQRFFIDVAFTGHEPQLELLRKFSASGRVVFGSDFPWEKDDVVVPQLEAVNSVFADETRTAALKLFPRFARSNGK